MLSDVSITRRKEHLKMKVQSSVRAGIRQRQINIPENIIPTKGAVPTIFTSRVPAVSNPYQGKIMITRRQETY